MAETPADVRRDIELTRNRISDTLQELEQKVNVAQVVRDHPWPALALAVGAGVLLSGSKADVKAAAATVVATRGASGRIAGVLDDLVSQVVGTFHGAIEAKIASLANEVKQAIGAPVGGNTTQRLASRAQADLSSSTYNTNVGGDGLGAPRAD